MAMTLEIIELLRAFQSGLGPIRPDDEDEAETWDRIERAVAHLTQPAQAVDVVNERCQKVMRERCKPYPRTCYVCGLWGPCVTSDSQLAALPTSTTDKDQR